MKPMHLIRATSIEEAEAWLRATREARAGAPGTMGLHGALEGLMLRERGAVEAFRVENGISAAGFDFVAHSIGNRAATGATAAMGWIAIGTGTTAFSEAQTLLATETARGAATFSHTVGTKTFNFTTTFAAGTGTGTITESGVFNVVTANSGTMLDRVVFAGIVKAAGDTLQQTFVFTLS